MWSAYQVEPEKRPCECPFHQAIFRPRVSSPLVSCATRASSIKVASPAPLSFAPMCQESMCPPTRTYSSLPLSGMMLATGMRVSRQAVSVAAWTQRRTSSLRFSRSRSAAPCSRERVTTGVFGSRAMLSGVGAPQMVETVSSCA